ncbi:MAG: type II toxin-antitoxin system death-on-curing family toxin [Rikenellaceae bacterium]
MIYYITNSQALDTHAKTIEHSGGGTCDVINIGYLYSVLDHIQNDDYYPEFEDKLTHLIYSVNKNHSFADGNKRISITLGAQFLLLNGYMFCIERYMRVMENISYHLAAGRIKKELLLKLIKSILGAEDDFNEDVKFEYLMASAEGDIGFDE